MPRDKVKRNKYMFNYMRKYRKSHFFTLNQIKAAFTSFLGKESTDDDWTEFVNYLYEVKG